MKQKNIPLFALSALLLFSGCNTETALTTTSGEMTTTLDTPAVTEEVTAAVSADEPDAVIDDEPEPETIDPSTMRDLSMPENLFDLPDPSGYEGLEHYTEQYKFEFTNFDQAIISLVDKSEFEEWVNEHEQEILTKGYSDTEPLTILSFIERFDIPEEKMLEAVKSDTHDIGADCTLDEYDVWRFYNHSTEENLRYYKTGYAIYCNGRVFSPMWLYEHTLTAYYAVGLTADYIRGYRSIYEDIFTLSKDSRNMTDKAWKAFNDKLEAYIISYSENQNRRKYVFDLSAENSEIPEGFIGGWIGYDAFGKTRPDITVSEKEIRIGDHSYEITGSGSDDKISYILYSAGDENMCLVIERKAPYTMYDAQYGEFHDDGTVGTIISDGNNRYIKTCRTNETEDGLKYKEYVYRPSGIRAFDDKFFEMLEKVFYGTWTSYDDDGKKHEITLTYKDDYFAFENWCRPDYIIETDEIYVFGYIAGGCQFCYLIEKSAPGVLYRVEPGQAEPGRYEHLARIYEGYGYTRSADREQLRMPETGEISPLGLLWLANEYGEEFANALYETFEEKHLYEGIEYDGRAWSTGGSMSLYYEAKMYLVSRDDDTVTLGRTYLDSDELDKYMDDHEKEPTVKTFALTFAKNASGEWSFTGFEPLLKPDRTTVKIVDECCNEKLTADFSEPQTIADSLIEQSVICYYTYLYASSAIVSYEPYDGDIKRITKHKFFDKYSELEDFIKSVYNEKCSNELLNNGLYLRGENDELLFDISKMGVIMFDDFQFGYRNSIEEATSDSIKFNCFYSVSGDSIDEYETACSKCHAAPGSDGHWKLCDIIWL